MKLFDITICGTMFEVVFDDSIEHEGEVCYKKNRISLDNSISLDYQRMSLIHEIMHVLFDVRMEYTTQALAEISDEDLREHLVIGPLSNGLYEVLKQNKHLGEWLLNDQANHLSRKT